MFSVHHRGPTTLNGHRRNWASPAQSWISDDKKADGFTLREDLKWSTVHHSQQKMLSSHIRMWFSQKEIPIGKDSLKIGSTGAFQNTEDGWAPRWIYSTWTFFLLPHHNYRGATSSVGILPKHALATFIKAKDSKDSRSFYLLGNKYWPSQNYCQWPHKIENYTPSQRSIWRNPYYWRKDSQGNQLPYVERIVWQIIESTDTTVLQFRSGDWIPSTSLPKISPLKREEKRGRFTVYNGGPKFQKFYFF